MENASKALIMAGGILIAVVLISALYILFTQIGGVYSQEAESLTIEQLEEYNRRFATYNNISGLYGSELLSLANLVHDYNNRLLYGEDPNSDFYKENEILIYVTINNPILAVYADDGTVIYQGLAARKNANIEYIKNYNDGIEARIATMEANGWNKNNSAHYSEYTSMKSLLTELRSIVFRCDGSRTEYNEYGRISKMYFEQT